MTRKTTWANSDNLNVGFGPNYAERQVAGVTTQKDSDAKTAKLSITYQSTLGASGASVPIPAGSSVKNVYIKVGQAWVGGTSLAFGDTNSTTGWVTATQGATANLLAGALIQAGGAYAIATGTSSTAPKPYPSALSLYFTVVGTYTAGTLDVFVEYV